MWVCPKCSREFKNINQSHSCNIKFKDANDYIVSQDKDKQEPLHKLYETIKSAIPTVNEKIAWNMPYFTKDKKRVSFCAGIHHMSFFASYDIVKHFIKQLDKLNLVYNEKGTIQLPYDFNEFSLIKQIVTESFE